MREIWKKVVESKVTERGERFPPNTIGEASVIQFIEKESTEHGAMVVVEFMIDKSVAKEKDGKAGMPGMRVGLPFMIDKQKAHRGALKALVLTLLGVAEADVSGEDLGEALGAACSKDQPLRGLRVTTDTFPYTSKGQNGAPGRTSFITRFGPIPGQDADTRLAVCKVLDEKFPLT